MKTLQQNNLNLDTMSNGKTRYPCFLSCLSLYFQVSIYLGNSGSQPKYQLSLYFLPTSHRDGYV